MLYDPSADSFGRNPESVIRISIRKLLRSRHRQRSTGARAWGGMLERGIVSSILVGTSLYVLLIWIMSILVRAASGVVITSGMVSIFIGTSIALDRCMGDVSPWMIGTRCRISVRSRHLPPIVKENGQRRRKKSKSLYHQADS
jgi:hypothetical protein